MMTDFDNTWLLNRGFYTFGEFGLCLNFLQFRLEFSAFIDASLLNLVVSLNKLGVHQISLRFDSLRSREQGNFSLVSGMSFI